MSTQIGETQIPVLAKYHAIGPHFSAIVIDIEGVEQIPLWTQNIDAAREHVGSEAAAILVKRQAYRHADIVVIELALLSLGRDLYHRRITRSSVAAVEVALPVENRPFQAWHEATGGHLISNLCTDTWQIREFGRQVPFRNTNHLAHPSLLKLFASERPVFWQVRSPGPVAIPAINGIGVVSVVATLLLRLLGIGWNMRLAPADEPNPPDTGFGEKAII